MLPKQAQRVAEQLEREILSRRIEPGQRLGTEPELMERYGVSRALLREAIRLVERHQIAETRKGANGGLFVSQPAEDPVARVLCAYLESIGLEFDELFEARKLLELALVHHAAIRSSRREAERLEEIVKGRSEPGVPEEDAAHFDRFWACVGDLSRSPMLALFVRTLRQASNHFGLALPFTKAQVTGTFRDLRDSSLALAGAIKAHDPEVAKRTHKRYLDQRQEDWAGRIRRTRRSQPQAPPVGDPKRGEALARSLAAKIRRDGLQPGDRLGSETELTQEYGVGRAGLREAVRLLEQHGIAETKRGFGGGLIVASPDPEAVIRSASVYLSQLNLSVEAIKEARQLIEPSCAAWVAERATDEQLVELTGALGTMLSRSGVECAIAARVLHEMIADLGGNRALSLFIRVAIDAAWSGPDVIGALPDDALETLRRNDMGIVGALHDRDPDRTRVCVKNHIEMSMEWWRTAHAG